MLARRCAIDAVSLERCDQSVKPSSITDVCDSDVQPRVADLVHLPFEQVADRVRHTLREQATRRALRHYLLALEAEIGVEGIELDDDSASSLMQ